MPIGYGIKKLQLMAVVEDAQEMCEFENFIVHFPFLGYTWVLIKCTSIFYFCNIGVKRILANLI